jgi:hypothetical protein
LASQLRRVDRRLRYGKPIVVVSGLPRSGTSMLMKMLEAGGLPLVSDGQRVADEDNPKGYYEDERVKNLAQDPDRRWLVPARGKAIKVISYLLKDLPPHHNYQVLFIRRSLKEVLASQGKMLERRGEPAGTDDERMKELFESDLWKATYLLKHQPQFEVLELQYKDVLANARDQAGRISRFLGGSLDVEAMTGVVDRQLYRNRAD